MKMGRLGTGLLSILAAASLAAGSAASPSLQELSLGEPSRGRADDSAPAVFQFSAASAGFLTTAVRGIGDVDLILTVTDDSGQPLHDARSDQDLMGNSGAEQLMTSIVRPGNYLVKVETWSGAGEFEIAASWIAFPSIEEQPDPDGRPSQANVLAPGSPVSDALDSTSGDHWDWFSVTSETDGVLTVILEAPEGDLALEVFEAGEFGESLQRSDQDQEGVPGNESITIRTTVGRVLYFKVSPVFDANERIPYALRAGVM